MKYPATIINAVRAYTNRAFISGYKRGSITLPTEIRHETFFEIRGSQHNDGFYFGEDNEFTEETFQGFIVYFNIPLDVQSLLDIDKMLGQSGDKGLVRREQLDEYSYTLDTSNPFNKQVGGIPVSMLSALNHYRVLPSGVKKEYHNAGII